MRGYVRPYKSKAWGIFLSLVLSGIGMMIYVDTKRGFLVSIIEIVLIALFGVIAGIFIGTVIATFWSKSILNRYREMYERFVAYERYAKLIKEEGCPIL